MTTNMYAVFDVKSEAYLQPFFFKTHGLAIRAITDCVNDENHQFCKYASDYTLFHVGIFDDSNGSFESVNKSLGNFVEFKNPVPNLHAVGGTQ